MIGFAAERLIEIEVGAVSGAVCGEKNPRLAQRNGCRDRAGRRAAWAEKALTAVIQVAYV